MSRKSMILDLGLRLLAALGLLIALVGIGLDLLPSASPGINLPQLMLIACGVCICLLALSLRRKRFRRWCYRNLPRGLLVALVTLFVLEGALTFSGLEPYYPADRPEDRVELELWRTCDDAGCRFRREIVLANCSEDSVSPYCKLNPQGYADSQAFTADASLFTGKRVLMLGDSFTFGMSADPGHSFVETMEKNDPEGLYWNAAVPGAGTHHALASFEVYAPLLQPHITVLGFFLNDFENNMISLSDWRADADPADKLVVLWRDLWGNPVRLDQRSAFYYRKAGIDPPASPVERAVGATRLGTLILRFMDAAARIARDAEGTSSQPATVTRGYLRQLRDAALALETNLIVMLIPRPDDIGSPSSHYQLARQLLGELQIDYFEPMPALDAGRDYAADGHWNSAGHQTVGKLLGDFIANYYKP